MWRGFKHLMDVSLRLSKTIHDYILLRSELQNIEVKINRFQCLQVYLQRNVLLCLTKITWNNYSDSFPTIQEWNNISQTSMTYQSVMYICVIVISYSRCPLNCISVNVIWLFFRINRLVFSPMTESWYIWYIFYFVILMFCRTKLSELFPKWIRQ